MNIVATDSIVVDLFLFRANFGVEAIATNLTQGTISILMNQFKDTIELTAEHPESELNLIQFEHLSELVASPENHNEDIRTTIFYNQFVDGDTISSPMFDEIINFKRNFIKRIIINAPDSSSSGKSGFSLVLEDVTMSYDTLVIN